MSDSLEQLRSQSFTESCGDEIIPVYVGDERRRHLIHRRLIEQESPSWNSRTIFDINNNGDAEKYLRVQSNDTEAFDQVCRWLYCKTIQTPKRVTDGTVSSDEMVLLLRVCTLARDLGLFNLCAHAMDYFVRASFWDDFVHSVAVIDYAYSEACTVGQIRTMVADAAIYSMRLSGGAARHLSCGFNHIHNIMTRLEPNNAFHLVPDSIKSSESECFNPMYARSCSYHPHQNLNECPERGFTVEESYNRRHYRHFSE